MCENGPLYSFGPAASLYTVHFDVQWLTFLLLFQGILLTTAFIRPIFATLLIDYSHL
jgi:hypothetical protein